MFRSMRNKKKKKKLPKTFKYGYMKVHVWTRETEDGKGLKEKRLVVGTRQKIKPYGTHIVYS